LFHANIIVTLRASILDPQGKAVEHAIHSMKYRQASNVRIGKFVEMDIDVPTKPKAEEIVRVLGDKLLTNPVMEDFTYTLEKRAGTATKHPRQEKSRLSKKNAGRPKQKKARSKR
jgi:phosphoribosylformylglycinamidine synthase